MKQTNKKARERERSEEEMQRRNGADPRRQTRAQRERRRLSPAPRAPGCAGLAGRTGRPAPTLGSCCCRQPGGTQDSVTVPVPGTGSASPENPRPRGGLKGTLRPRTAPSCPAHEASHSGALPPSRHLALLRHVLGRQLHHGVGLLVALLQLRG